MRAHPNRFEIEGDEVELMKKYDWYIQLGQGVYNSMDGSGYFGTETWFDMDHPVFEFLTGFPVHPDNAPKWATHVAWFNK